MMPDVNTLLDKLPPYQDQWIVVSRDQDVNEIIREILNAHEDFAPYYNEIALCFDGSTVKEICKTLYQFCKENLQYVEETEQLQSTSTPAGLLTRGHCDCKGYATFCAGIIDGIKRLTGKNINWNYRFASYNAIDRLPHHVFVVVNDNGKEIWIDPTPGADKKNPSWVIDKTVKTKNVMPLVRNIAGVGYLPLPEDFNFGIVTDAGTVDAGGSTEVVPVEETFIISEPVEDDAALPQEVTEAINTLNQYGAIDAEGNVNDEIIFSLANTLAASDFQRLQEARYLLEQQMVSGFFSNVFRGVKKVALAVPRNAYLSLVALNVFGTATKINQAISTEDGKQKLGDKWYKLGGKPDALFNAARSGAKKPKILGSAASIGAAPAVAAWVATATAIIAALTPLINSILKSQQQQQVPYTEGYNPLLQYTNGTGGTDFLGWIKSHPLESAGIGLLLILAYKKFFANKRAA